MSESTTGYIDMKDVPDQAAFMQSVKDSIESLVKGSYYAQAIDHKEPTRIPLLLNQARLDRFEYSVSGGRESFVALFSLFVSEEDYSTRNPHKKFKATFGSEEMIDIPNESRMLYILPKCMDAAEIFDGPKMCLSLGNWGESREIITRILNDFGADYYFQQNDCADDGYEFFQPSQYAA